MHKVIVEKNGLCKLVNMDFYILNEDEIILEGEKYLKQLNGKVKPFYQSTKDEIEEKASTEEVNDFFFPNKGSEPAVHQKTVAELEEELLVTQMAAVEQFERTDALEQKLEEEMLSTQMAIVEIYEQVMI